MNKTWGACTQYVRYEDDLKLPFKLHDENGVLYRLNNLPNFEIVFFVEFYEKVGFTISKTGSTLVGCDLQADTDGSAIIFANIPGKTFSGNKLGSRLMYKSLPKFSDQHFPGGVYKPSDGGPTGKIYIQ
jgi:hypothetical protein